MQLATVSESFIDAIPFSPVRCLPMRANSIRQLVRQTDMRRELGTGNWEHLETAIAIAVAQWDAPRINGRFLPLLVIWPVVVVMHVNFIYCLNYCYY